MSSVAESIRTLRESKRTDLSHQYYRLLASWQETSEQVIQLDELMLRLSITTDQMAKDKSTIDALFVKQAEGAELETLREQAEKQRTSFDQIAVKVNKKITDLELELGKAHLAFRTAQDAAELAFNARRDMRQLAKAHPAIASAFGFTT